MIARSQILAVLLCLSFQAFGNPISSEDIQICTDLCNKCNGKTIIKDGKCECSITGDDKKGAECMKRMAQEGEQLEAKTAAEGEERSVRCLLGSRRKYKEEDVQRIAQYFMGGGPLTGSPLKQPCEPSEKMVGASKSDLQEPPRSGKLEPPKLASTESETESEDPTVGAAKENPWCPCSVFGKSQSGPVQPANTYPKSEGILGSAQELQKSEVSPAESKEILGAPPKLKQPQGISASAKGMLGVPQLQQPLRFSADARGNSDTLQQLQLPQSSSAQSRMLGAAQQPFSELRGFLGSLQLQVPQISANSGGMLGSSQVEQPLGVSAGPGEILGNFQLQLPQFSTDSRGMLGSSQGQQPLGVSADPRGILGNFQLQLPQFSTNSRFLGASQQIQQPQYSSVALGQMLNPQPFFDIAEAIGRIQIPIPQTQSLVGDSLYKSTSSEAGSNLVGATQSKVVGAANCKSDCCQSDPKVGATKNTDSDIVGAAKKKAKVVGTPKTSDIVGAANCKTDYGQSDPKVGATKNTDSDIVGAAKKKAKVVGTPKTSDIVGAANCRRDCGKSDPKVHDTKNTDSDIVGASLPVQPGYTYQEKTTDSAPKTSLPQIKLYTLNDLAAALAQRSVTGISNAVGRFQIPRHQIGEPRQQILGAARSNSNSNNDPNDLEIMNEAAPPPSDAELQADDETIAGAPFRPRIGTLGLSWIPQTVTSVIGIFQPLVEQGVQLAVAGMSGQQREFESQQVGMARSQFDFNYPQVGLATPETNLGAPQRATFNSPLGLSAQYLPNSNGYLINSQFSLPMLPRPNSPTVGASRLNRENNYPNLKESSDDELIVGAPRKIGAKKIGQRSGALMKLTRQSLRDRVGKSIFPREANENSEELPDEVIDFEANAEATVNIIEEAVEKEIETLVKSEDKTLEQELEKREELEKPLKKREDKPGVKLIKPKEKSVEKVTEKTTLDIKTIKPI